MTEGRSTLRTGDRLKRLAMALREWDDPSKPADQRTEISDKILRELEFEDLVKTLNKAQEVANEIGWPVGVYQRSGNYGVQYWWQRLDWTPDPNWELVKLVKPKVNPP